MTFTGQTPTFKNPPFTGAHPVWDLPTVFGLAERAGLSWDAYADQDGYPVKLIAELNAPAVKPKIHGPGAFLAAAKAGTLPRLCFVWSPVGYDEHPPYRAPFDPAYMSKGQDLIWQQVDAVVTSGQWAQTTFILTYDDWGGYADHVATPNLETLPDALHPAGFQAIGGARLPLTMFGGHVRQGIDNRWHSHASIAKTVIDLLGLPALKVPRVDTAPTLAGLIDPKHTRPAPPAHGSTVTQPTPPKPTPKPKSPPTWTGPTGKPMPALITNTTARLPPPTDGIVRKKPPKLPPH